VTEESSDSVGFLSMNPNFKIPVIERGTVASRRASRRGGEEKWADVQTMVALKLQYATRQQGYRKTGASTSLNLLLRHG
jgi:hypothetical protein